MWGGGENAYLPYDCAFQATLLWHDGSIGWSPNVAYRWQLHHRPDIGTIRFYLYRGNNEVMDSGNIYDDSLKGGRLGLYCFSQEEIIWSNVKYTCEGKGFKWSGIALQAKTALQLLNKLLDALNY